MSHIDPDITEHLRNRLHAPTEYGVRSRHRAGAPRETAVAVVLRPVRVADAASPTDLELLVILRAERAGDVWSGHVALPGGRADLDDPTLVNTAARECLEEVGLALEPPHAVLVGALDLLTPRIERAPSVAVQPFVWIVPTGYAELDQLRPQPGEVAAARWVPIGELRDVARHHEHDVAMPDGSNVTMRGIHVDLGVPLWGITLRIVEDLLERLDSAD